MSGGSLWMSDAKPRRQTELSNHPFPSQTYLVEMHSFYTQNTQMVGYQNINTIFCHVFKVYVTKLSSTMCITVWVLKANTSKTEMKKTGRKIPPRNTIPSHFHWNPIPIHIWPWPTSVLPSYIIAMIQSVLSIISSPSVYKGTFQSENCGHHAMQMYKEVEAHVWGMEVPLDLHPSYT
jgi:hypothetical protein